MRVVVTGSDGMLGTDVVAVLAARGHTVLGHHRWYDAGITPIGPWQERWDAAAATVLPRS